MSKTVIIAMDGPAGAGKSTVARRVAQALGFTLLDTGALYRAVALAAERAGVAWTDAEGCASVAAGLVERGSLRVEPSIDQDGTGMDVFLDGEDVGRAIRSPHVSMGASTVSAIPGVRNALLDLQRGFGARSGARGVVCEGRDIGTVIFPHADVKVFLTASVDERAARRHREVSEREPGATLAETRAAVIARDAQDEGRAIAPLRRADDAVVVDSTSRSVEGAVAEVLALVRDRVAGGAR